LQGTPRSVGDAYVVKLDATGASLLYATYLGGSFGDSGNGIAVDAEGNAYVTGQTNSFNFPTTPQAFQVSFAGGRDPFRNSGGDAFVVKLDSTGSQLVYSTYLGGILDDIGQDIEVNSTGNAFVIGQTASNNFPTLTNLQDTFGGVVDAFVVELDQTAFDFVFSTYLGGSGADQGLGLALDASGNVYVTGVTDSTNFPTTSGAFQGNFGGGRFDAFVTKLNPTGSTHLYSSYLGGSQDDRGIDIAVDTSIDALGRMREGSAINAYVTGTTTSTDFPTKNAMQDSNAGATDAFVAKVNAIGSALEYSTYVGGADDDRANGIAVTTSGSAYFVGSTNSMDFPTAAPIQAVGAGGLDVFVARLNEQGSALVSSTYLGGSDRDIALDVAVDCYGFAYVTGQTASTDFPTTSAFQPAAGGIDDAFVTKVLLDGPGVPICQSDGVTTVEEAGTTDTYSILLTARPTANVTITATSDAQLSVSRTLTFTPANWGTAQTVTVAAVDDSVPEGTHSGTITHTASSADGNYNGTSIPSVTATIIDNDNNPPSISDIPDQTTPEDTATPPIPFTVGDVETPSGSLIVTGTSSNTTLVPNENIVFGGSGANRTVTITPAPNQSGGPATITVTVTDADGGTAIDPFKLTVRAVNDRPTISDIPDQQTDEDTATLPIQFTVGDVETPSGSLIVSGTSSDTTLVPNENIVFGGSGANRTVTITPAPNQSGGPATITVTVTDADGGTASDTFVLTVLPVNDLPVASDGTTTTAEDDLAGVAIDLSLLVNDLETADAELTYTIVSGPSHGSLTGAGMVRTYVPNSNFNGTDTFTYRVTDRGDPNGCGSPAPSCSAPLSSATKKVTIVQDVSSPTIRDPIGLRRDNSARRKPITQIVLAFSEPLDESMNPTDTSNYVLRQGRRDIGVSSAIYDPDALTVTLTPGVSITWKYRSRVTLTVRGTATATIVDRAGNQLDGNNDGQPGGDLVRRLSEGTVLPTNASISAVIVDALLERRRGAGIPWIDMFHSDA
jgi:hypothetical protein